MKSVDDGWTAGWKADELYPQQSVSKAVGIDHRARRGRQGPREPDDKVTLGRSDLTLFHQPIAAQILGGGYTTTCRRPDVQGDHDQRQYGQRQADALRRRPESRPRDDRPKGLGAIRFYDGRACAPEQDRRPDLDAELFDRERLLPGAQRPADVGAPAAFDRYVEDPYDGAAPSAIVDALARLKRGELLSPPSTARLLSVMGNTKTGANRLKGGLKPGWTLSHKTGTGQYSARCRPATTTSVFSPRPTAAAMPSR